MYLVSLELGMQDGSIHALIVLGRRHVTAGGLIALPCQFWFCASCADIRCATARYRGVLNNE